MKKMEDDEDVDNDEDLKNIGSLCDPATSPARAAKCVLGSVLLILHILLVFNLFLIHHIFFYILLLRPAPSPLGSGVTAPATKGQDLLHLLVLLLLLAGEELVQGLVLHEQDHLREILRCAG